MLIAPIEEYALSYAEALDEGFGPHRDNKELSFDSNWIRNHPSEFIARITQSKSGLFELPSGELVERVPSTDFWYVQQDHFVGSLFLRHHLSPALEKLGGHIGYEVRPNWQRKGIATEMLRDALFYAKHTLQLQCILVTCNDDNLASVRVIEKNGGLLSGIINHPWIDEKKVRHYWIDLKE